MAVFKGRGKVPEPIIGAWHAVDARVKPDFRKAVLFAVLAVAAFGVGRTFTAVHHPELHVRLIGDALGLGFVVFAVIATRNAANEAARLSGAAVGTATAAPLRVVVLLVGYLIVLLAALDLFAVPVGHLLLGGAVTGIILGIAAQQALGNVFAGLVLLVARPYVPGERVRVIAGSLGGRIEGIVVSISLLYTAVLTSEGVLNIPNSALLAAAVGPAAPARTDPAPAAPAAPAPASAGQGGAAPTGTQV